jgi:hypothetical protein
LPPRRRSASGAIRSHGDPADRLRAHECLYRVGAHRHAEGSALCLIHHGIEADPPELGGHRHVEVDADDLTQILERSRAALRRRIIGIGRRRDQHHRANALGLRDSARAREHLLRQRIGAQEVQVVVCVLGALEQILHDGALLHLRSCRRRGEDQGQRQRPERRDESVHHLLHLGER